MMPLLVGQDAGGGFDIIWLLLPILCCLLLSRSGGDKSQENRPESDNFYTSQSIQESFEKIEEEIVTWRQEARERKDSGGILSKVSNIFGGGVPPERFIEKEKKSPRLLTLTDSSGPVYFEFTEVEGGGTVVKATYSSIIKAKVARLKAKLPLKVPAVPIGLNCPSCGKPVMREFNLCPYCGSQLIKE